ncbi:hypothetical protein [Mycolicibacterium sp. OfavD-34-C]|uniref:hypothetical protein n=1 Tax=Mycolicibacterium sp. OfavD-34-C TaxID=2917746 RepID=UPI001EF7278D|nr:hypothetical protein [Mycolicibacterium sp. OfavD-34-C]MCG7582198.1 hypothetical protein [Mycolicibacterium sp. OfavD-34-C]
MNVNLRYTEFDVTPHVETSATVDRKGEVTDTSVTLFPYGDHEQRSEGEHWLQSMPVMILMSLEEAEVMARLLTVAVKDARNGSFDEINRD